jgi:hypothetical protein
MNEKQPGMGEELVRTIVHLPKYALEWTLGLLIVTLSEYAVTAYLITGVLAGLLAHSVLVGLLVFFGLYTLGRFTDILCRGMIQAARLHGGAVVQAAQMQPQQLPMAEFGLPPSDQPSVTLPPGA